MTDVEGHTDRINRITLPSAIEQVQWTRSTAAPGGSVQLEIYTHYVGNGASLRIVLADVRGRTHGTFRNQLYGNHFSAPIQVPPEARDGLYAEVKLPKLGLDETSPALFLTPPIDITDVRWSQSEARRGDVLALSADVPGAPDGTEASVLILEHDADGAHDPVAEFSTLVEQEKVEVEWEYEYHEDTDDIPTEEETEKGYLPPEYFFRVEVHGLTAESGLLTFKDWIEIALTDPYGNPLPGEDYVLRLPDGQTRTGTLDDDGQLREVDVPPGRYFIDYPGLK